MLQRALVIADDSSLRRRLESLMPADGILVKTTSPENLWSRIGREPYDLIVATGESIPLPVSQSVETLNALPDAPRLIVALLHPKAEERARFQSAGVFAVVDLELDDQSLREALETLTVRSEDISEQTAALEREAGHASLDELSSSSASMQHVLSMARRVAATDSNLMILGETGVGKEWLSRAVHLSGGRAEAAFVAVNCAAIPDSMLESELFGHEMGAFTGAHRAHRGYFEQAHGGTLFLDEIGEMAPQLQTRLLRVLQDGVVQRLGGEEAFVVDVRVMAATNREVHESMQVGALRSDLYYRLAVVTLEIPPLRERREDILPLFLDHLEQHRARMARWDLDGRPSEEALAALQSYSWPGNVRELINVAERAIILAEGERIELTDLPHQVSAVANAGSTFGWLNDEIFALDLDEARDQLLLAFETEYLERLLAESQGQVGRAAERAGITARTLYNKMKRCGLDKATFRKRPAS